MQAFGWVMRGIGLLILLVAALVGLLAFSELLRQVPSLQLLSLAAARVWFVLLAVVVAIVVLWLVWRVLRALVQVLFTSDVLGDSATARLIGLGAAALVFPQALWALLNAPLVIFIELFRGLPERTRVVVTSLYAGGGDSMPLEAALLRLVDLLQLVGAEIARTLDRAVQQMPLVDTALAFALWALVAAALRAVPAAAGDGSGSTQARLVRAWLRLTAAQRYLAGLGVVFVLGGFLSIASIVAIPWLKEDKVPAGLTQENLQKALQGLATPAADLDKLLPQDFAKQASPFEALDNALPKDDAKSDDPLAGYARQVLARTKGARASALQRAADQRDELLPQQARVVESALRAFQTESTQPMSAQERLFFYRAIQRQVADAVAQQLQGLSDCRRDLETGDRDAAFVARDAANAFAQAAAPGTAEASQRQWDRVLATGKLVSAYERACTRTQLSRTEFVPPEAGSGWGPFGKMANWLLRTKSFALALITGMLGFGLLGASIAAYVRTGTKGAASNGEIGRVVVRGLSAAVVLFLAVKGGLAVLTVGEQDPNAYVLFFFCLVGAVYSEDVWNWARSKFLGKLGDGKGSTGAPAPPPAGS